ncbi:hypothetical protein CL620_02970 [archaeon]|nr:hypothetical protein [archaeon]|tara:strand:- start:111 stop:788 length:678 start_codon:yes stop_codon:yes gene_type:complete
MKMNRRNATFFAVILGIIISYILKQLVPQRYKGIAAIILLIIVVVPIYLIRKYKKPNLPYARKVLREYKKDIEETKHPLYLISENVRKLEKIMISTTVLAGVTLVLLAYFEVVAVSLMKLPFIITVITFFVIIWAFGVYYVYLARHHQKFVLKTLVTSAGVMILLLVLGQILPEMSNTILGNIMFILFFLSFAGIFFTPLVFTMWAYYQYIQPGYVYRKFKHLLK